MRGCCVRALRAHRPRPLRLERDGDGPRLALAGVSFAVNVGTGWAWPLFVWGLAIGLLLPIISETVHRVAASYLRLTPEEVARSRALVSARRLVIIPTGVALGLTIGLVAASWMVAWVDRVATVIVVLSLLPVFILFPALKRKREGHSG
jgi:hypothetical protein